MATKLIGSLLISFVLAVLLTLQLADGAQVYKSNSDVAVYVNKVGPYFNPHETYHYYKLPVCRPTTIVHKSMTLGELLDGDRMALSMFELKFRQDVTEKLLCSKSMTADDLSELRAAIEDLYYFEFVVDDIPIRGFVGHLKETAIVPHSHKIYIWPHFAFTLYYSGNRIVYATVSMREKKAIDLDTVQSGENIRFTYSAKWVQSSVKFEDRDKLIKDTSFFPKSLEIHWLSVINSLILVLLLIGFLTIILFRILRKDFARYNLESDEADEDAENGWKIVHTDVFRPPKHKCFFSATIGVGAQFLAIITGLFTMALLGLFNVHHHGNINAAGVVLYAFTSSIAGFVSCRIFRRLGGERWARNVMLTSFLFIFPLFFVWAIVNSVAWAYGTTQALPWSTVILLLLLWLLLGFPLTIIGGIIGKNAPPGLDAPCRTKNIPREIPSVPWYRTWPIHCLVGGFLSFSGVSVELYYIYATVWGRQHYSLYGILAVVYAILLSVTACVSVALTYFQLAAEDYRWWWRSVFSGGSSALFVLLYSLFYYYWRTNMTGLMQAIEFFGYTLLLCYVFFLTLGTVSFVASMKFVRYIYSSVKMD